MKKKLLMVLISVSMIASVFTGCGNSTEAKDSGKAQTEQADTKEDSADKADGEQAALEDGTYTAEFQTDSTMRGAWRHRSQDPIARFRRRWRQIW